MKCKNSIEGICTRGDLLCGQAIIELPNGNNCAIQGKIPQLVQHYNDGFCPFCGADAQMGASHWEWCPIYGYVVKYEKTLGFISEEPRIGGCTCGGGESNFGECQNCGKMA